MAGKLLANPPVFVDNYTEAQKISEQLKQPMILIFSADWCKYCIKLKKDITQNIDKFENTTIAIVDIEKYPKVARKYKVTNIPRSIFFDKEGRKIKDTTGYSNIDNFTGK